MGRPLAIGATLLVCLAARCCAADIEADTGGARKLLLAGHYAEAEEAYAALAGEAPVAAAIGVARAQASRGSLNEAVQTLEAALEKSPEATELLAELAVLSFQSGDHEAAEKRATAAVALDENCLAARWIQAELQRTAGKLEEAAAGYEWFVTYYRDHDVKSADDLHWIGLAAGHSARWNRRSEDFKALVNDLYPSALQIEAGYWPALYEQGMLFLEKYNQAEASRSFKEALELNPSAAEVHAGLAKLALQNYDLDQAGQAIARALELNPRLVAALQCQADLLAANFKLEETVQVLVHALTLDALDEATLGRLAGAYVALDGLPADLAGTRTGRLIDEVNARNPHAGEFYFTLAEQLSERRKFPSAERFYREAIERMPQLVGPHAGLGMMYMRMGQEVEAEKLLNESFDIDPFNIRVSNTLKVLEVLSGYAVLETDHFILKFDRAQDEILARYAAKYLEEHVYPTLTKQFAFEPEGKSLFEIFNRAKNTNGHGWFSARMVGLPYIGTVGACAGKMVALASPNDMDQKYNWARVLKHEFVHVLNLQQTHFNIPHWFTEALAVLNENYPRPQIWNDLLAARTADGKLFNLDTINLGFIRPQTGLDWQMAYCQAELYAEYMLLRFGDDALAKMLAAYADNLSTSEALKRCFQVEQAEFEKGYLEHVKGIVAGLTRGQTGAEMKLAELEKAHRADPKDPDVAAKLAAAHLERRNYKQAGPLAKEALAVRPKHPLATFVLARLRMLVGEEPEALAMLEECLDRESPDPSVLGLLASLKLKAADYAAAASLYELGQSKFAADDKWAKGLARVYLASKNDEKLAVLLAQLADKDADDLTVRKKLAQIDVKRQDFPAAATWANQALQIDVMDVDAHGMLAAALAGQGQFAPAAEEYEIAVRLKPKDPALRFALAQAHLKARQIPQARAALEALLKLKPDYPGAKEMLEGLP